MQFRDHPGVQGKRDAYPFDPRMLKIEDGYNVRNLDAPDERAELDELKESIRANGVRTPLEVRLKDDEVFVTAGHRRHKAVMELIAEGEPIKAIPVIPEPKTTTAEDRVINLVISNSGKPLKPLEVAEVVRRLVAFGWEKQNIAKRLGKSASAISGYLDMIAMPEPVKEQVRENAISATEAAKLVKGLAPGVDPKFAADLIKANKEENKRLGVGAKNGNKVTAKTLKRDKPAAPKEAHQPKVVGVDMATGPDVVGTFTPLSDDAPPAMTTLTADEIKARAEALGQARLAEQAERGLNMQEVQAEIARIQRDANAAPPPRSYDINQKFFAIVCRLATIAEGYDLNALADDHMVEIPAEVLKAADRDYRAHVGDA